MNWYPLRFSPIPKPRPWGGRALAELYHKALPPDERVGESWEVADRPGDASVVINGPWAGCDLRTLMEAHAEAVLGAAAAPNWRFPLLVKILDAREVLSVQVHPPPELAARLGGEPKTELWYVTHAAPGAHVYAGLKPGVSRADFEQRLRTGQVAECLHQLPMRAGDALFLPSGRLHALGSGLVLFEIQQNSDTTYRVFDWNRTDAHGRPRELHLEAALACIRFDDVAPARVMARWQAEGTWQHRELVNDPLFRVAEHRGEGPWPRALESDRVRIYGVVEGRLCLEAQSGGETVELAPGQFSLVPAAAFPIRLQAARGTTFLEAVPG